MKLLVLAVAVLVAYAASASACVAPRTSQTKLEGEVMCPVCHTTLDQSDSLTATQIKRYIQKRICAGASEGQIKQELVADFGPAILAAPPQRGFDLLAWWLPLGGIIAGALAIGYGVWRWSRRDRGDQPPEPDGLDPELERRVDDALRGFEA